ACVAAYLSAKRFRRMTGVSMARAFLFVLDSFGIGGAPDAGRYGDEGADTFGHIEAECAAGRADIAGVRAGPLRIPHMRGLGLAHAAALAHGRPMPAEAPRGISGPATAIPNRKDSPSGRPAERP